MDWTIVGIILTFVTALGVWLGPRLAEKSRRRFQSRKAHFEKIKDEVLRPLLNQLEEYYLPVVTGKINNIVAKSALQTLPEATIDQLGAEYQIKLSTLTLEDLQDVQQGSYLTYTVEGLNPAITAELKVASLLYSDLKDNHECKLVEMWEVFVSKVNEYNDKCFKYVTYIAKQLAKRTGLIVWSTFEHKPGINTAGLASLVWAKQLGIRFDPLRLEGKHNSWTLLCASQVRAIGTEEEMKNCREVVKDLAENKKRSTELRNSVLDMGLNNDAQSLKEKLVKLIESHRLKGDCTYTKI